MPNKSNNDSNKVSTQFNEYLAKEETREILTYLTLFVNKDPQKLQYLKSTVMPMLDILIFACNVDKDDQFMTVEIHRPYGFKADDDSLKNSPLLKYVYEKEVEYDVFTNETYPN